MTGLASLPSGRENCSRNWRSGSCASSSSAKSSFAEKCIVINDQRNVQRPTPNSGISILSTLNYRLSTAFRRLHELDGHAVRIAYVDDALAGIRAFFECLRFAGGLPS